MKPIFGVAISTQTTKQLKVLEPFGSKPKLIIVNNYPRSRECKIKNIEGTFQLAPTLSNIKHNAKHYSSAMETHSPFRIYSPTTDPIHAITSRSI